MYRRGPARSTPAIVQCQKCLQRDRFPRPLQPCPQLTVSERHYSYECKTATQERPYVSRPSRTQQLFNPKLVPKLSDEVPTDAQRKKGVADALLAKQEAERAKKRALEDDDADFEQNEFSERTRPVSSDSVSPISRAGSPVSRQSRRSSVSTSARHDDSRSPSPMHHVRRRRCSSASGNQHPRRPVESPPRRSRYESLPRPRFSRSRSPVSYENNKRLQNDRGSSLGRRSTRSGPRRKSFSGDRSPSPDSRRRYRSRSHDRAPRHDRRPSPEYDRYNRPGPRSPSPGYDRYHRPGPSGRKPTEPARQRERSLSPFSKRLALTQAMNMGR